MADEDFAITSPDNDIIRINKKALRNRGATIRNLTSDRDLAADEPKGIAIHEMGHVIHRTKGINQLELAEKTYYNIYGVEPTPEQLIIEFDKISEYCHDVTSNHENLKPHAQVKYMREIMPEALSSALASNAHNTFAEEYVRLLREMI